jgi:hypothetical protein
MKYKIIDNQQMGTHEDEIFDSKQEVAEHLISYHNVDFEGEIPMEKWSLNQILDYGDWSIEKIC